MHAFRTMTGTVFVLYLTLVNVAAWCEASHAHPHESTHQHSSPTTTHSPLCTWACQVSIASSSAQPSAIALGYQAPQWENLSLSHTPIPIQTPFQFRSTRAPPYSLPLV